MPVNLIIDDDVAEVVLDNPGSLNALDRDGLAEVSAAYVEAEHAGVRALILRGEGRAFCAGRDISHVDPSTDDGVGYLDDLMELMRCMDAFPAPTFAVAHGACLGVGLGLLIVTDVVYVSDDARIGSPFANLGAILDSGGHALFYERLGAHRTLDLMYTAELMSGPEAVALGLFSRLVPLSDVLEFTRERARRVAAGPTKAFLASRKLVAGLRDDRVGFWKSLVDESAAQVELGKTHDFQEGFGSFGEKRKPIFTGQ